MDTKNPSWLSQNTYQKIIIREYTNAKISSFGRKDMTDHPKIIKEITDSWVIQNILSLLTELPTNGDKMKSFTDTIFLIEIDFVRADSIIQNQIDFWGTHIKTPSTGFLSEEEDLFKERPLGIYRKYPSLVIPCL